MRDNTATTMSPFAARCAAWIDSIMEATMKRQKASVCDNTAATLPPFAARCAAWLEAACILHSGRLSDSERDGAVVCTFARHHFCLVARSISFVHVSDRLFLCDRKADVVTS